jgi:hypothetical protein
LTSDARQTTWKADAEIGFLEIQPIARQLLGVAARKSNNTTDPYHGGHCYGFSLYCSVNHIYVVITEWYTGSINVVSFINSLFCRNIQTLISVLLVTRTRCSEKDQAGSWASAVLINITITQ